MGLKQRFACRQPLRPRLQSFAAKLHRAQDRSLLARLVIGQSRSEFTTDGDRHFRRGGGGGCAPVGGIVCQRSIGLVTDRADHGNGAIRDSAHHDLLVEAPQVLDRTAAARYDHQIGAVWMMLRHGGETAHCAGNLLRRALSLDQHGPHDHPAREAIREPMEDIANHRARGRGDHADGPREEGQRSLAVGSEQAFGSQPRPGFLEQRQQGTLACQLHPLDHDLVLRSPGIGGQLAARDDFEPVFGLERQSLGVASPHDPVEHRLFVLERAIHVAARRALHPRQLAAQADETEPILDGALERLRNFADRQRLGVVARAPLRYQSGIFGF